MAKLNRSTGSMSQAKATEIILNKGIVVDAWVTVSIVGLRLIDVEARVFISSLDTYTRHANSIGETLLLATAI